MTRRKYVVAAYDEHAHRSRTLGCCETEWVQGAFQAFLALSRIQTVPGVSVILSRIEEEFDDEEWDFVSEEELMWHVIPC